MLPPFDMAFQRCIWLNIRPRGDGTVGTLARRIRPARCYGREAGSPAMVKE
jgi:hypothetical protein